MVLSGMYECQGLERPGQIAGEDEIQHVVSCCTLIIAEEEKNVNRKFEKMQKNAPQIGASGGGGKGAFFHLIGKNRTK